MSRSFSEILDRAMQSNGTSAESERLAGERHRASQFLNDLHAWSGFESVASVESAVRSGGVRHYQTSAIIRPVGLKTEVVSACPSVIDRLSGAARLQWLVLLDMGLKVDASADATAVKRAWRKLMLVIHPDRCRASGAHEMFVKASAAYQVVAHELNVAASSAVSI